jgi:glutamine---fructose-6-phosphate transaminase (isomerizing)
MCGIVGYLGQYKATNLLLNGLRRLEYRGYDSAGISVIEEGQIKTYKKAGKVKELATLLKGNHLQSKIGIAHTRWATHGYPNDINAHPHVDNSNNISIVHNGIIENYGILKKQLINKGYSFKSDTDSEVLAVLIGAIYDQVFDMEKAIRIALTQVEGTFGIVAISTYEPDKIIGARLGSPMVVGIGESDFIIASDVSAIVQHTRQVIYLEDNEMVIIDDKNFVTKTIDNIKTKSTIHQIDFEIDEIEKAGYEHFMLKEIFEQPVTFKESFRGRLIQDQGNVKLGGLKNVADQLRDAHRIIFTACGTSWHSALVAEYLIENLCQIPVEVEYASEFRYRNPVLAKDDVVFAISQSGETADTLAAIKEAKLKGATTLGIVNVVGSSIARETQAGVYIHAGPEIGVASTKAFTSQLAVLTLIALFIGRMRNISMSEGMKIARELEEIPSKIQSILDQADKIKEISLKYKKAKNFLYLGRGYNFPIALEGALKLKEISYIHAEGYPAAEMKHGPIALIHEDMPVVFIALKDEIYDKVLSNIEEVKARKGKVIVVANEGDEDIKDYADHVIYIPKTLPMLSPVLSVIVMQLIAYYIAVDLGCNVDQPRNLAKSVTVE